MNSRRDIDTLYFVLSLLGFVLVFIPFPWHLKAGNTTTCLFMAWMGLSCLVFSVNSMLWNSNSTNLAPIWCDISAKFLVGASAAISSVSLCINFRLWFIATDRVRTLEKRGIFLLELFLGLGVPLAEILFQYIVQDRWFDIYEGVGCHPVSANVLLMYILLLAPQLLFGTASVIFCILTLMAYHRMYKFMLDTQPSPTFHRRTTLSVSFLWFLTLGFLATVCGLAYASLIVYLNATADSNSGPFVAPFKLWASWDQMHFQKNTVNEYEEEEWRGNMMIELTLEANRWIFVGLALISFLFFGFTMEARRQYRMFFGCGGRKKWQNDDLRTLTPQGEVHDAKSAESGYTDRSTSTLQSSSTLNKSLISTPHVIGSTMLPEDPFKLENPYPVHIHETKPENASLTTSDSQKNHGTSTALEQPTVDELLPPPVLPRPWLSTSKSGSWDSLYSESSAQESIATRNSSTSLLPHPPFAHAQEWGTNVNASTNKPTTDTSHSAPSSFRPPLVRSRSNSASSAQGYTRRSSATARARSSSRNRSASITSPPTGPLPDPPPEVPSTPSTVVDFPSQAPSNHVSMNSRGRPIPLAVPFGSTATSVPVPASPPSTMETAFLAARGRTSSRSRSVKEYSTVITSGVGDAF